MAIPKYQAFYIPFLEKLSDGEVHQISVVRKQIAIEMNFSEEELNELTPGKKQNVYNNRVGWAATYLKKAGLVKSPKKAYYKITDYGMEMLKKNPEKLDNEKLMESKDFRDFKGTEKPNKSTSAISEEILSEDTPQEIIANEMKKNQMMVALME